MGTIHPKISVVTVSFNCVQNIELTILSVINQTYSDVEYIVIDGGSTDGTVDIIKSYSDRISYWISESDKGIYDAMNKGIAVATGDYVCFMNSGDQFYNDSVIENCFAKVDRDSVMVYGNWVESIENTLIHKKALSLSHLSKGMAFPHQSAFIKMSYHKQNRYCLRFPIAADYNLFFNAFIQREKFQYVDEAIAIYDMNPSQSFSLSNYPALIKEHLDIQGENNKFTRFILYYYKLSEFLFRSVMKKMLPFNFVKQLKLFIDKSRRHSVE